jgi:hypothetical protein
MNRPKESYHVSNKQIKKPLVWGGQGPYKNYRATEEVEASRSYFA